MYYLLSVIFYLISLFDHVEIVSQYLLWLLMSHFVWQETKSSAEQRLLMRPMKRCEWKSAAKRVVLQKVIKSQ